MRAVLERRSQAVNVNRVYRLHAQEGLAVRQLKRKRLVRRRAIVVACVRVRLPRGEFIKPLDEASPSLQVTGLSSEDRKREEKDDGVTRKSCPAWLCFG